jgi:hypothetical protein
MADSQWPRIVWISLDDGAASVQLEPFDEATGRRIDRSLDDDGALPIRFATSDADTEGHAASPSELIIDVVLGDDTEGHAVRMRFPTAQEAAAFRQRVLAAGTLVASVSRTEQGARKPNIAPSHRA